jgi:hypothetical protein
MSFYDTPLADLDAAMAADPAALQLIDAAAAKTGITP